MEGFVAIIVLLLIASGVHVLSRKYKLPYTIMLFVVGMLLIPLGYIPGFSIGSTISLTPDILFYIFLPILIFEAGYSIKYQDISRDHIAIWLLATMGICLSVALISGLSWLLLGWVGISIPWSVLALFGIIISATDPVAVLSLFKDMGVPHRLSLLFEGESLFNDGTAVALFSIALAMMQAPGVLGGGAGVGGLGSIAHMIGMGGLQFLVMVFGGIFVGIVCSRLFARAIKVIHNNEVVEITLTMILAHMAFISTDLINVWLSQWGHWEFSGVIATAYAAIIMGNYGKTKISPVVEKYMDKFWSFFAFLANSLIFILMGLLVGTLTIPLNELWLPALIVIVSVMIARAVSIYVPIRLLNLTNIQKMIPLSRQHLMAWGSLRGALAVTLVLLIPDDLTLETRGFPYSIKMFILGLVLACVMFSLIVKGLTMKTLIRKLGIDKLHMIEIFEKHETAILLNRRIVDKINDLSADYSLAQDEYEEIRTRHQQAYVHERQVFIEFLDSLGEKEKGQLIKQALLLHALGIEKQHLQQLFEYNEIDEPLYIYLNTKLERQIVRVEQGQPQFRCDKKQGLHQWTEKGILYRCINKFSYKKHDQHDYYLLHRAKYIITQKVLQELEGFKEIDFGYDTSSIDEVMSVYDRLHADARASLLSLKQDCCDVIDDTNKILLYKGIIKEKISLIHYMYDNDIITHKLYEYFLEIYHDQLSQKI